MTACFLLAQAGAKVGIIISAIPKEKQPSHWRKENYSLHYLWSSSPGPASLVKKSSILIEYATQKNIFLFEAKCVMNIPMYSSRQKKSPGVLPLKCSSKGATWDSAVLKLVIRSMKTHMVMTRKLSKRLTFQALCSVGNV